MIIYTKHHLKFEKNQAKTLICGFCADFLSIVLLVFSISISAETTDFLTKMEVCGAIFPTKD